MTSCTGCIPDGTRQVSWRPRIDSGFVEVVVWLIRRPKILPYRSFCFTVSCLGVGVSLGVPVVTWSRSTRVAP